MASKFRSEIRQLRDSLERIRTLLAWLDFTRDEQPSDLIPPAYEDSQTRAALSFEIGHFWSTYIRLKHELEKAPAPTRKTHEPTLNALWTEFYALVQPKTT